VALAARAERAIAVRCDVWSWDDQQALVEAIRRRFGRIDAVFANPGLSTQMGLLESSREQRRARVVANVLGPAYTIRATLPQLLEQGSGDYLLTSSLAARKIVPGSSAASPGSA
jgi:NADP-dependent 3-hydroxy acid dehydrogenase YdfG